MLTKIKRIMKIKGILSVFAAMAILVGVNAADVNAQYYGGPGIAMSGSATQAQLPAKAKNFINKHYKGVEIKKCEQYYAKGKYEVELVTGVDLEFNSKGDIVEIDAPGNSVLPKYVLKDLLPRKAYSRLEKDGYINYVDSIEFKKGKAIEVGLEIPGPDTYVFDIDGVFLAIQD